MSQTYNPKKRKRKKTHGFRARQKTATGQKVLKRRRQKGRKKITIKARKF
ncbi:MAG: 50S ribosomal protein L34 [Patescibacteria group bacterium]